MKQVQTWLTVCLPVFTFYCSACEYTYQYTSVYVNHTGMIQFTCESICCLSERLLLGPSNIRTSNHKYLKPVWIFSQATPTFCSCRVLQNYRWEVEYKHTSVCSALHCCVSTLKTNPWLRFREQAHVSHLSTLSIVTSASLKEAVRTWPHSDPVSWAQRTSSVSLLKRLDQNIVKAVVALRQSDPKYCRGQTTTTTTTAAIRQRRCSFAITASCVLLQSLSRCSRGTPGSSLGSGAPPTPAWCIPPPPAPSASTSSSATTAWRCCWELGNCSPTDQCEMPFVPWIPQYFPI